MSRSLATQRWLSWLQGTGRLGLFVADVGLQIKDGRFYLGQVIDQGMRVILRCFLPILAVTGPFGMIVGVQGNAILKLFGAHMTLPSLISLLMLREVSPLMVGIMLSLQSGSGFAGELGTMRVKEEIDATEMMGINPSLYHVLPRILAITVAGPILYALSGAIGVSGGALVAIGENISFGAFFYKMTDFLSVMDILGGAIKTTAFGFVAGTISCYHGFYSERGARGVARSTNRAVVSSVLLIVVMNYFLSSALYGFSGG